MQRDELCLNTFYYNLEHKDQAIYSKLDFNIDSGDSTNVFGYYSSYFKLDQQLVQQYQHNKQIDIRQLSKIELQHLNQQLNTHYTAGDVFKTHTWLKGNTVQLKNKQQLLALGILKTPLQVQVKIQQHKKSYSVAPIGKGVTAIVAIPIGLVLMLPYTAVIAYCESGKSC